MNQRDIKLAEVIAFIKKSEIYDIDPIIEQCINRIDRDTQNRQWEQDEDDDYNHEPTGSVESHSNYIITKKPKR